MTWDEIYEAAEDACFLSPELKRKDQARHEVHLFAQEMGLDDPEDAEIPEEAVEDICRNYYISFGENGSIEDFEFPEWVRMMIHRSKETEYRREDIQDYAENKRILLTEEQIQSAIWWFEKLEDSNVAYNVTLELAVKKALEGE